MYTELVSIRKKYVEELRVLLDDDDFRFYRMVLTTVKTVFIIMICWPIPLFTVLVIYLAGLFVYNFV